MYLQLRTRYQQQGDHEALNLAQALLAESQNLTLGDRERLLGYLEGGGRSILTEPSPLLTEVARMPGLDGRKMSKSYGNTISLREDPAQVETSCAPCRRIRRESDAVIPAILRNARCGIFTRSIRMKAHAIGLGKAVLAPVSAAWNANSR